MIFNLFLIFLNGIFKFKAIGLNILGRLGFHPRRNPFNAPKIRRLPEVENGGVPVKHPSILFIVEDSISQCYRYRVQQKIDQAKLNKSHVAMVSWRDGKKARYMLHFCHIAIFFRVPAFPDVVYTINYAKSLNKLVFFDVDDLIFDREHLKNKFKDKGEHLSTRELNELLKGAALYRSAMELCPYGIASTPALAEEMEKIIGKGRCFVHRNALDDILLNFAEKPPRKIQRPYVSIFYGSGTKTHDADLNLISQPLSKIMEQHKNVRITLVGPVKLPKLLKPYVERIDRIDLLDIKSYLDVLAHADINIAPLEPGSFANVKSEIKWLEAAIFRIPTLVSNTKTYEEILTDFNDAMIADTETEWYEKLNVLITQPNIRKTIGEKAFSKALELYSPDLMAKNLQKIFLTVALKNHSISFIPDHGQKKWKLLFVNVLYPPQDAGGATVVVESIINQLMKDYRNKYEITVFTYDRFRDQPYELYAYTYNGVEVTSVSIPIKPDMDWEYKNEKISEIFYDYLKFQKPDLIHFHSIQRLTASTLSVAREVGIPYVVTLHDTWWISDHQFMVDETGRLCNSQQNDPIIAMRTSENLGESLRRRRYLRKQLTGAKVILAVSKFQTKFYESNGIENIIVNKNGLSKNWLQRLPSKTGNVRLGYLGGVFAHKGYHLLKEAIEQAELSCCELTVVDFSLYEGKKRRKKWGKTDVTLISRIAKDKMPEFYREIDVLIAPSIWPESFGLVSREAKLAGVWVVAANAGGLAEDVDEGVDGNVFTAGQVQELVNILRQIEKNPQFYRNALIHNKDKTVQTIKKQVAELDGIYRNLLF